LVFRTSRKRARPSVRAPRARKASAIAAVVSHGGPVAVGVWAVLLERAARPSGSNQIHSCLLRRGPSSRRLRGSMMLLENGDADRAFFTRRRCRHDCWPICVAHSHRFDGERVGGWASRSPAQDVQRRTCASMLHKHDRARVGHIGHSCRQLTCGDHTWPAKAVYEVVGRHK